MTQKHTACPWTYQRLQPYMKGCAIGTGNLANPTEGTLIATAWNTTRGLSGPQDAETEANARFIIQACNAHEELLTALTAAQEVLHGFFCGEHSPPAWEGQCAKECIQAKAAIAKAEGR